MPTRSVTIAAVLISIYLLIQFLWYSQSILIPLIFAVLIWNILRTMANTLQKTPVVGSWIPSVMAIFASFSVVIFVFILIGRIVSENLQSMMASTGDLQNNLSLLLNKIPLMGMDKAYVLSLLQNSLKQINFQRLLVGFYSAMTNFMSSLFLIMLFVLFFFLEQVCFDEKISRLFVGKTPRDKASFLLQKIPSEIQRYLGLKSLFSALTASCIYILMKVMGVEFAEFWGVCIFLLNFIPNIGALVMTLIITLFAYFQWLDVSKVMLFFGLQVLCHAFIGNFLETHYLGRKMHLSPLFLLLALGFWGSLWGGMGLFLAVPMTVLMMIILSSFESTRFWAILMSENGELPNEV